MNDVDRIRSWKNDPVRFVREVLGAEPDAWQEDVLRNISSTGINRVCMKACVGPGKSTVLAWLGWWFLLCFKDKEDCPKGAAVAITADNLKDNLWTEMKKWQDRSRLLSQFFTWQRERIFQNEHPDKWFLSARSFAKAADASDMGKTLSGLHSKYVFVLLDETGEMSPAIGKAAEQAMSTVKGNGMGMIAQAGNPMSLQGLLYDSAVTHANRWQVTTITSDPDDTKRTPRIPIEWAREQIDTTEGGRQNPWIQYSILGEFPAGDFNALLTVADVEVAMKRQPLVEQYDFAGMVYGIDVARQGIDASVIFPRQGIMAFDPVQLRTQSGHPIVGRLLEMCSERPQDAIFIDNTGGWGGSVIDTLQAMNHSPIGVGFAEAAADPRFANKRTEMWWRMAEWIKAGGCLPNVPELIAELTIPTYGYKGDKMILEPKDKIRERLGRSPDYADALALTFAQPVGSKMDSYFSNGEMASGRRRSDYARSNPLDRLRG